MLAMVAVAGATRAGARAGALERRAMCSMSSSSRRGSSPVASSGPRSWLDQPSPEDAKQLESKLTQWLTSHGVYLAATSSWGQAPHPLGIASETKDFDMQPSGRGLLATSAVRQGDPLFRIPEKVCITLRTAREELGEDVIGTSIGEHEGMALLLMRERALGDESFWAPYIGVLPQTAEEVSASWTWSDEELRLLEGSAAVTEAREFQARLQSAYDELSQPGGPIDRILAKRLAPADAMAFDQFQWAMAVLFSRAINMREMDALVLAPYADLLNHSPGSNAIFEAEKPFLSNEYEIVCYADRLYSQMEQVADQAGRGEMNRSCLSAGAPFAVPWCAGVPLLRQALKPGAPPPLRVCYRPQPL